jgi:hypothetical protein
MNPPVLPIPRLRLSHGPRPGGVLLPILGALTATARASALISGGQAQGPTDARHKARRNPPAYTVGAR